jgi:hypothetical protein
LVGLLRNHIEEKRVSDTLVETPMRYDEFSFGCVRIDGKQFEYDVIIDCGQVTKRSKKPSKKFREEFGHTPLSLEESIPWKCSQLVIGTGVYGRLPVMLDVRAEAERRGVKRLVLPTVRAIAFLKKERQKTNAILHLTC